MKNKSFSTFFAAALIAAMVLGAGFALGQTSDGAIIVQKQGTMVTFAGGTAKAGGVLHVRVGSAAGRLVFEKTSRTGIVDWMPNADLPNGRYYYDAWFTPAAALPNRDAGSRSQRTFHKDLSAGAHTRYATGVLDIRSGVIQPGPGRDGNAPRQLSDREDPSTIEYVAGIVLEFLVPSAAAGTCTDPCLVADDGVSSTGPDVQLQDFSDTSVSWWMGYRSDGVAGSSGDTFYMDDTEQDDGLGAFGIAAGAPDNSFFISATGEVGIGTANPGAKLHIIHGENGGIFFNAVGGLLDEEVIMGTGLGPGDDPIGEGFYIHDVNTNARILNIHKTANLAFMVDAEGDTGMGTADPSASLHISRSDGTARLLVAEGSTAPGDQVMFSLSRAGSTGKVRFLMSTADGTWTFDNNGTEFTINKTGGVGQNEFIVDADGDGTFRGRSFATQHVNTSSRAVKTGFAGIDEATILAKVAALDISQWRYKSEPVSAQHIGPMAEQFQAIFGLGDGKHISTVDADGIALAAIQALEAENDAKDQRIAELEARLVRLEAAVNH